MHKLVQISHTHPIIFVDGYCVLCSRFTQYILKRDKEEYFRFSTIQKNSAFLHGHRFNSEELSQTVVLLKEGNFYTHSDVAIKVFEKLSPIKARFLTYVPKPIRNIGYNLISKVRYRVFGKKESCELSIMTKYQHLIV